MRKCKAVLLSLLVVALARPASAAEVDRTPFVVVETGLHADGINRLAPLPGSTDFVTVSDDKTARIWSRDTVAPRAILRPPIGPRDNGALYAVAASAQWIAVAGRIIDTQPTQGDARRAYTISLFKRPDYAPAAIHRLPAPVTAMKFSADGSLLAVGMSQFGVMILNLKQRGRVSDVNYQGAVTWLDFDSANRLVVASEDGGLRLYDAEQHLALQQKLPNGAHPWSMAFSPDGTRIAVGDRQKALVHLLDGVSLKWVRDFVGASDRVGALNVTAFSPDGKILFGAGSYTDASGRSVIRRWPLDNRPASESPASNDSITDLLPLADGVIYATAEPSLGRLDPAGKITAFTRSPHLDFRLAAREQFRVSANGAKILLANGSAGQKLVFNAEQRTIVPAAGELPDMAAPTDRAAALVVTEWRNGTTPKLNGKPIALEPGEHARSVAVSAAARGVTIGTDFFVRFVGLNNWQAVTAAPAWQVNVSGDGKRVIAGLGDGTVHWYDAASGAELTSLFLEPETNRWVFSTPQGYFDHDHRIDGRPDGRALIGYRLNDSEGKSSQFIEIGQLYPMFFRPDLVGLSLRNTDDGRARIHDEIERLGDVRLTLERGLPAQIQLVEMCGFADAPTSPVCPGERPLDAAGSSGDVRLRTAGNLLLVRYRLVNADGDPGKVLVRRDGAVITTRLLVESEDKHSRTEAAVIALGDGANKITITPISGSGEVEASDDRSLFFTVVRAPPAKTRGDATLTAEGAAVTYSPGTPTSTARTLYMLSVGIDNYQRNGINLDNAAADAREMTDVMRGPSAPVYDSANVTTLIDAQATISNITAALKEIAAKAKVDDLVMIFLAGHGLSFDGKYYFAPVSLGTIDARLFDSVKTLHGVDRQRALEQVYRVEAISQDQIIGLIRDITATSVVLVLDTCYSALIANQDAVLQHDTNETVAQGLGHAGGRFVLSSAVTRALDSTGTSASAGAQHGLLTNFLLEALRDGKADFDHNGRIDVYKLGKYAKDHVRDAAAAQGAVQDATYYFNGGEFFDIHAVPVAH